jgi:hypothetical protein
VKTQQCSPQQACLEEHTDFISNVPVKMKRGNYNVKIMNFNNPYEEYIIPRTLKQLDQMSGTRNPLRTNPTILSLHNILLLVGPQTS